MDLSVNKGRMNCIGQYDLAVGWFFTYHFHGNLGYLYHAWENFSSKPMALK